MTTSKTKPISYWNRILMAERKMALWDGMKKGDIEKANELLSLSISVLAKAINCEELSESDVIVLDYIRTSIIQTLEGVPIERAFGIKAELGGRTPKSVSVEDWEIVSKVKEEAKMLKDVGESSPIKTAQDIVAKKFSIKPRKVREIWSKRPK